MLKTLLLLTGLALMGFSPANTGLNPGDKAFAFTGLKNVDGKAISLTDYAAQKGVILVFTCNHCPYAKAYEERIKALDVKYKPLGYPVVAIMPNDPAVEAEDGFDQMVSRAKEKGYTFPYAMDETQATAHAYGAAKTPHVYVLQRQGQDFYVRYVGAIDDNTYKPEEAKEKYVENAVNSLLGGKPVAVPETKAIGCTIKWKKA